MSKLCKNSALCWNWKAKTKYLYLYIWPVCISLWYHPCLPVLREGAFGLLVRGEALQSHYCHKVGHLSHVSLHAQSRWVTAVIGIRDYSTLWWLSLRRYRISTFPPAVCWVSANAKVKTDPSTPLLPVRNTGTKGHSVSRFQRFIKTFFSANLELCHFYFTLYCLLNIWLHLL